MRSVVSGLAALAAVAWSFPADAGPLKPPLDIKPPIVFITAPAGVSTVEPGATVEVVIEAFDNVGVVRVTLRTEGAVAVTHTADIAPPERKTRAKFRVEVPSDAASGTTITLHASAADVAENVGSARPVTLKVNPFPGCRLGDGSALHGKCPSPSSSATPSPSPTPTYTPAPSASSTATEPVPTTTPVPTLTATETPTNLPTQTPTDTTTETPTVTATATFSATATHVPTETPTDTPIDTPTLTPTPNPTDTFTVTATHTMTPTATPTWTPTAPPAPVCVVASLAAMGVSDASNSGTLPWRNPHFALGCDTQSASAVASFPSPPLLTEYLRVTNFNFSSIPDEAVVLGIRLSIRKNVLGAGTATDARVSLIDPTGAVIAENKAQPGSWAPNSTTSYGGADDVWGRSWSGADVKSTNFGWVLSANVVHSNSCCSDFNAFVNCGEIEVCYTVP